MTTLTHYNKCIRKITSAFGSLFNNIILIRENADGTENQRLIVPLEFGNKEKYVKRLQGDPELNKKTQISLPRMSYEMTGFSYDPERKLNTNNKNFATSPTQPDNMYYQFNPVPYDFNFSLTIYTRNIEDGNQIIEQIIPYFTPDYTLKINLVPDLGIVRNIPIILNTSTQTIDSDGLFNSEVRTIYWTLNFTIKGFIFGGVKDASSGIIKTATVNFREKDEEYFVYPGGNGDYIKDEIVYQGPNLDHAYSSGIIKSWNNSANTVKLSNIVGTLKLNQPLIGTKSLAIHIPYSYKTSNTLLANVTNSVSPITANVNSNWTVNTSIIEYQ